MPSRRSIKDQEATTAAADAIRWRAMRRKRINAYVIGRTCVVHACAMLIDTHMQRMFRVRSHVERYRASIVDQLGLRPNFPRFFLLNALFSHTWKETNTHQHRCCVSLPRATATRLSFIFPCTAVCAEYSELRDDDEPSTDHHQHHYDAPSGPTRFGVIVCVCMCWSLRCCVIVTKCHAYNSEKQSMTRRSVAVAELGHWSPVNCT